VASFGFAQDDQDNFTIQKGQWNLEGSFSINSSQRDIDRIDFENSSSENFNFSISPELGYAVADNLLVGLGVSYNYSKSEFNQVTDDRTSEANSFGFTPYIEKFFPLNADFALSIKGELSYSFGKQTNKRSIGTSETDFDSFFVGFRPGINYFVSDQIFLQANFGALGYESFKNEDDLNVNENNAFLLNLSTSSLFFGINILF
jgi:hypothetical protein